MNIVKSVYLGKSDDKDIEEALLLDMLDCESKTMSKHIGKIIFKYFKEKNLGKFDKTGKFVFNKSKLSRFKNRVFEKKRKKLFSKGHD